MWGGRWWVGGSVVRAGRGGALSVGVNIVLSVVLKGSAVRGGLASALSVVLKRALPTVLKRVLPTVLIRALSVVLNRALSVVVSLVRCPWC